MKRVSKILFFILLLTFTRCIGGPEEPGGVSPGPIIAGGPSPASPPKPPAELPVALQFPPSIGIDVSTVSAGPDSSALALLSVGDLVQDVIFDTAERTDGASVFLEETLNPLSTMLIPLRNPVTTFEDEIDIPPRSGSVFQTVNVKIDFTEFFDDDFDLNGDDSADIACSGSTCPMVCKPGEPCPPAVCPSFVSASDFRPICYRVWVKKEEESGVSWRRLMSGRFFVVSRPTLPGTGQFKGTPLNDAVFGPRFVSAFDDGVEENRFGATYNHESADFKITDFRKRTERDRIGSPPGTTDTFTDHDFVSQIGTNDVAIKTIQIAVQNTRDGDPTRYQQRTIGRWKEGQPRGEDFWGGSQEKNDFGTVDPDENFKGICALISTGRVVDDDPTDGNQCREIGTDVFREPFLDFLGPTELNEDDAFPPDFPFLPTF